MRGGTKQGFLDDIRRAPTSPVLSNFQIPPFPATIFGRGTPGKVGPLVWPDGQTAISKSNFAILGWTPSPPPNFLSSRDPELAKYLPSGPNCAEKAKKTCHANTGKRFDLGISDDTENRRPVN